MFHAKVWASPQAEPDEVVCSGLARVRELMDTYLAVGWWRIDFTDTATGKLLATVRYNESDPSDPIIMEVLYADAV